jgi:hypothetical protein
MNHRVRHTPTVIDQGRARVRAELRAISRERLVRCEQCGEVCEWSYAWSIRGRCDACIAPTEPRRAARDVS